VNGSLSFNVYFCMFYCLQMRVTKEKEQWRWSPLYIVLKRYPLQISLQCPWLHTKEELQNILAKLQNENDPFSLEMECPHMIKALKLFCRATFGRLHPLAHFTF